MDSDKIYIRKDVVEKRFYGKRVRKLEVYTAFALWITMSTVCLYIAGAFMNLEFDPAEWVAILRVFLGLLWIISCAIATFVTIVETQGEPWDPDVNCVP